MRKLLYILLLLPLFAKSQEIKDEKKEEKEIKKGFTFGAIPAIAYNSDLGLLYGGLVNFYHFGDGSTYPKYRHSTYLEITRTTKGSGTNRLYYDSEFLIPKIRISVDLSYLTDLSLNFYGFNGYQSKYNSDWITDNSATYKSRLFYNYRRDILRFVADFNGKIGTSNLNWLAGLTLMNFNVGSIDVDHLNEGKSDKDKLPPISSMPGLYEKYVKWNYIPESEKNGGNVNFLKAGIVYDSRDNEPNPMKGIFTEADLAFAPNLFGNKDHSFVKLSLTHRQYFTIVPKKLSIVYRLGLMTSISGEAPFYFQPYSISSIMNGAIVADGLGGGKSLRGVIRNRILSNDNVFGNLEARWKFAFIKLKKNNIYLALNAFYDLGQAINTKSNQKSSILDEDPNLYFDQNSDSLHSAVGAGFRFVLNQNFIIAIDYGITLDKRDGENGLYIGLNYLF